MKTNYLKFSAVLLAGTLFLSCNQPVKQQLIKDYVVKTQVVHPEWTENAVIYEVNVRQHTPEGTLNAFAEDLGRINEMGVDIIWLMPVFPIGELNRKISQTALIEEVKDPAQRAKYRGSYYSIRDYYSVNPEFGTMRDLKDLVTDAHAMGMYVILDIAVNHTAWDNPWVQEHPEYYTRIVPDSTQWKPEWMKEHPEYYERIKKLGMTYPIYANETEQRDMIAQNEMYPEETDWWDVADLNYNNEGLRREMIQVFKYWVEEADIDGYRCDVAGWVPCDFWNEVRASLDSLKPVFMLAEDEAHRCLLEKAFDMNYAWELYHIMNQIAKGDMEVKELANYFIREDSIYDPDIYRMNFITNHDENTWKGTVFERFGDATEAYALLTFTVPGMPLIYSGQEAGMNKRLRFFEKDTIEWKNSPWEDIYSKFIELKKENGAFWNGTHGGSMKVLDLPDDPKVFAFERADEDSRFIVLINFGDEKVKIDLRKYYPKDEFVEIFTQDEVDTDQKIPLKAYEYKVLTEE